MLESNSLLAEDITNYAVMNCSDTDHDKTRNVEDLINHAINLELKKQKELIELLRFYLTTPYRVGFFGDGAKTDVEKLLIRIENLNY